MMVNYFIIAWRMLLRTKGYSLINIGGLTTGMTVTMLIALLVYDELSFNKYHDNYDGIVQLWQLYCKQMRKKFSQTLRYCPYVSA